MSELNRLFLNLACILRRKTVTILCIDAMACILRRKTGEQENDEELNVDEKLEIDENEVEFAEENDSDESAYFDC